MKTSMNNPFVTCSSGSFGVLLWIGQSIVSSYMILLLWMIEMLMLTTSWWVCTTIDDSCSVITDLPFLSSKYHMWSSILSLLLTDFITIPTAGLFVQAVQFSNIHHLLEFGQKFKPFQWSHMIFLLWSS